MVTNEEKQRILAQARANIERKPPPYVAPTEPLRHRTYDPGPPEPEPEYLLGLDTTPAAPFDWAAYIAQAIEDRVMLEREFTMAVVGEALGNTIVELQKEAQRHEAGTLTQEITKLQSVCDELRIALNAERSKSVVDLPAWPHRTVRDVN